MTEHWIPDLGGAEERKAVWGRAGEARADGPKKKEGRMVSAKVEVRAAATGVKTIVGYGAVFNVETVIGNYFREQIMPGAFKALLRSDVRSLFNHDPNYVLGRTGAGTLTISEDAVGLLYTVSPPASRADVVESLERGDVTGSSFGFVVKRDEWTRPSTATELPLRTIWEVEELLDVGPVTFPAYVETSSEARNAAAASAAPAVRMEMGSKADALMTACMDACRGCVTACGACVSACASMVPDATCGALCRACTTASQACAAAAAACLTACATGDLDAAALAAARCQVACEACVQACAACVTCCATIVDDPGAAACVTACQACSAAGAACIGTCAAMVHHAGGQAAQMDVNARERVRRQLEILDTEAL